MSIEYNFSPTDKKPKSERPRKGNSKYEPIITAFFIIGLYYSTSYELDSNGNPTEKNILWFVRYYVDKFIGEPFGKPIILCPRCMASIWGGFMYFIVLDHPINHIGWFIIFVFVVSALNNLLQATIERW